jgi:hypothetical protein
VKLKRGFSNDLHLHFRFPVRGTPLAPPPVFVLTKITALSAHRFGDYALNILIDKATSSGTITLGNQISGCNMSDYVHFKWFIVITTYFKVNVN